MIKGKLKKEHKHLSIMLIPHSPEKVKIFRFTTFYFKLWLFLALFIVSLTVFIFFTLHTITENRKLKANLSKLSDLTAEQNLLINEKADEIDELTQKEMELNQKVEEFRSKYKEMTDNYLSGSKTNRGGDRNERSFLEDAGKLKSILEGLEKASTMDDNFINELAETENKLAKYSDTIPTQWPASGRVSSDFGYRKDPISLITKFHSGIDVAASYGQDISAAASGKIVLSGWYGTYGYAVMIDHGNGICTLYGHSSKLLVREGLTVNKGDVIAKVGSSGNSTGPHLHFEVRVNETPVDPLKYLDK